MDWNAELLNSAWWLLKAYFITLIAFALVVFALSRLTVWGRQFWVLSGAYFSDRRHWKPLAGLALILLLTLFAVRMDVLFSMWYNTMYASLQNMDEAVFWFAMQLFAILATVHVVRALADYYVQQSFIIHWRKWLNARLLDAWLGKQAYFRTQYLPDSLENPDQRIQQDITIFAQSSLTLSMGMVNAIVSTMAFTLILWNLSGTLPLFGVDIPRGMVFLVFVYVLVATVFAIRIGRPLILLNFLNERFSADYRYALVRLREYAESIAFYAGERVEGVLLRNRFSQVIGNAWAIVRRSLRFLGFNFVVSQTAAVFPFLIQAKRFFSKEISLGDLVQTAQAFGALQSNLSFFRNAYDEFASYRATLDRLSGFTGAIAKADSLPTPPVRAEGTHLTLRAVDLTKPDGTPLVRALDLHIAPGQSLLIRGSSGVGKTTLLRTIAGLWPYSRGSIVRPAGNTLFLSQKPYLPLGSLREALYYPTLTAGSTCFEPDPRGHRQSRASHEFAALRNLDHLVASAHALTAPAQPASPDADAIRVLEAVQLGHLIERLDEVQDWSRMLSLGEQQRLAFGRLLLAKPVAAFLDEATSAMDEGLEDAMIRLIRSQLPDTLLVSVGHRSTLLAHHDVHLHLGGEEPGAWFLQRKRPTESPAV